MTASQERHEGALSDSLPLVFPRIFRGRSMLEAFLILLAGGVMLAAAVSDPKAVTLHWLRLAGIIALAVAGIATYWFVSRDLHLASSAVFRNTQVGLVIAVLLF